MATYPYSGTIAARQAATDDLVAQMARSSIGSTSGNSAAAPMTTAQSKKATANQAFSNTTTAPAISSDVSRRFAVNQGSSNTTSEPAILSSAYSNQAVTQTPPPAATSSYISELSRRSDPTSFSSLYPGPTASQTPTATPTATQKTTPAAASEAATSEAATAETPKSTAYTPTTVRTTTAANNQSTTNTAKSTPATYTPTGIYDPNNLRAYNDQRVADIRSLYEQALQNSLAGMRTAYDQNMSDAQAARDQISPQYQRSMNSLSAEYERQRRNNNMQAAANGLNTGAGSQMALAQSANYQANQAGLSARENEALNEANRRIGDLQRNYQNAIAEATANNNYKLAASLMEEYQNAYNRQMQIENTNYQRAQQIDQQNYTRSWNEDEREYSRNVDEANRKAQYGDFSGYAALYGDDAARLMEQTWAMQNPYQAWASGKLSAEDFYAITGKLPANPADVADQLAAYGYTGSSSGDSLNGSSNGDYGDFDSLEDLKSYYGKIYIEDLIREGKPLPTTKQGPTRSLNSYKSKSYIKSGYGRGYSASRDRAYRGAPGYLNSDGQYVIPGVTNYANTTPATPSNSNARHDHTADAIYAAAYADAKAGGANNFSANMNARETTQTFKDKSGNL